MSQTSHSQLALKKRSTTLTTETVVCDNQKANRKVNGLNDNNKNDKDIIVIDDEYAVIPIAKEEAVDEDSVANFKKKRNRRSKNSSDSRESSEIVTSRAEETTPIQNKSKSGEKSPDNVINAPLPVEDFPTPETSPKTVANKLTSDVLHSKRRSDRLQNASTIVNLSTVSVMDHSTRVSSDTFIDETPSSERQISGRRSTRLEDDFKFAYRTSNAANDSLNATTNATLGSDIGDVDTPATDRKRRLVENDNFESPKRSRMDLSALFNNFYSPVSILRNKFKRTNLESTPKIGSILLDDSTAPLDSSTDEMKEINLNEKSNEAAQKIVSDDKVNLIVKPKKSCSIM